MSRVQSYLLYIGSLAILGLGAMSVAPGWGVYPPSAQLPYTQYPTPGTYGMNATPTGYCDSKCVVFTYQGERIRVSDPRRLVSQDGLHREGWAVVTVVGKQQPTLVGWKSE